MSYPAAERMKTLPVLDNGWIVKETAEGFLIETETGRFPARKAAGCLIKPLPGDYVLLTADVSGEWYILSVLNRAESEKAETDLEFTGQVNLRIKGAGLAVESEGDISVISGTGMSLVQPRISLEAEEGEAAVGRFSFLGRLFRSRVGLIESVADNVDQAFIRLTQKLIDHFRYVEEHEEIQTQSTRYLVEDTLTMQARHAEHTAEEMVKIHADQIHMG